MSEHRTVRELARRFGSKRLLAANIAVFALIAWSFSGEYMRDRDARATIVALQRQEGEMRADIAARNDELDVTPAEVENEARLKLNMRRPGEEVVVVKGESLRVHAPDPTAGPAVSEGNAAKWWRLFFE